MIVCGVGCGVHVCHSYEERYENATRSVCTSSIESRMTQMIISLPHLTASGICGFDVAVDVRVCKLTTHPCSNLWIINIADVGDTLVPMKH